MNYYNTRRQVSDTVTVGQTSVTLTATQEEMEDGYAISLVIEVGEGAWWPDPPAEPDFSAAVSRDASQTRGAE